MVGIDDPDALVDWKKLKGAANEIPGTYLFLERNPIGLSYFILNLKSSGKFVVFGSCTPELV